MLFLKASRSSKCYVYLAIHFKKQPDSILYTKADFMLAEDRPFLTIIPPWSPVMQSKSGKSFTLHLVIRAESFFVVRWLVCCFVLLLFAFVWL